MVIKSAIFSGSSSSLAGKPSFRASELAFIGRSNVGKSSLINMLCGRKEMARTSSNPGKTLCINHYLINDAWYLVDLPGYGFAKVSKTQREKLQVMIQDFIGKSDELKMLFILLDSRHDLQKIDGEFIQAVHWAEVPFALIYTKCDKMGLNAAAAQTRKISSQVAALIGEEPVSFCSSAETGLGREEILDYISNTL